MKTMINYIFTIILAFNFINAISQESDIRNVRWGMTVEEVIKSEGIQPTSINKSQNTNNISLDYETSIEQRKVIITYMFENNKLSEVDYRYHWGSWQNDNGKHAVSNRLYSLDNFFKSLKSKNFKTTEVWDFGGTFSPEEKSFKACQNYPVPFDYTNEKIEKLTACCENYSDNKSIVTISIRYSNTRTLASIKLSTLNYYDGLGDTILAWVSFTPKIRLTDF